MAIQYLVLKMLKILFAALLKKKKNKLEKSTRIYSLKGYQNNGQHLLDIMKISYINQKIQHYRICLNILVKNLIVM